jgi:hypothetical protein
VTTSCLALHAVTTIACRSLQPNWCAAGLTVITTPSRPPADIRRKSCGRDSTPSRTTRHATLRRAREGRSRSATFGGATFDSSISSPSILPETSCFRVLRSGKNEINGSEARFRGPFRVGRWPGFATFWRERARWKIKVVRKTLLQFEPQPALSPLAVRPRAGRDGGAAHTGSCRAGPNVDVTIQRWHRLPSYSVTDAVYQRVPSETTRADPASAGTTTTQVPMLWRPSC